MPLAQGLMLTPLRLQAKYQLNCSSEGLRRGDSPSIVRLQIFTGWLLARDTSTLPCGLLQKVAYNTVSFPQNEESESPQDRRQSFYNFISIDIPSLCPVLLVISD